jgi:predicted Zn-dependent protease
MKLIKPFVLILFLSTIIYSCKKDDSVSKTVVNSNSVGSLSKAYLSDDKYSSLTVDVIYEQGAAPTQSAVDSLEAFLDARLNKPNGLSINLVEIPDQQKSSYSLAELRSIESSYRNNQNSQVEVTAYLFYANGDYSTNTQNSQTLGIAYSSSSMVVFGKTIRDNTGGLTQPSASVVEQSVMNHEFGHILGLVNLGAPMQTEHQDDAHGKHCDNKDCLMYWATETGDFISNLAGSNAPQLDSNCIADLRANGGK